MLGNLDRGGTIQLRLWRQRRTLWARKAGLAEETKVCLLLRDGEVTHEKELSYDYSYFQVRN